MSTPENKIADQEMETETVKCKKCGTLTDTLAVFPGGICLQCHERKFNATLVMNGGELPRPDFRQVFSK